MTKNNTKMVATRVTAEEHERLQKLRKQDDGDPSLAQYVRRVIREHLRKVAKK